MEKAIARLNAVMGPILDNYKGEKTYVELVTALGEVKKTALLLDRYWRRHRRALRNMSARQRRSKRLELRLEGASTNIPPFLEEVVRRENDAWTNRTWTYVVYEEWCKANNTAPVTNKMFYKQFRLLMPDILEVRPYVPAGYGYRGITFNEGAIPKSAEARWNESWGATRKATT